MTPLLYLNLAPLLSLKRLSFHLPLSTVGLLGGLQRYCVQNRSSVCVARFNRITDLKGKARGFYKVLIPLKCPGQSGKGGNAMCGHGCGSLIIQDRLLQLSALLLSDSHLAPLRAKITSWELRQLEKYLVPGTCVHPSCKSYKKNPKVVSVWEKVEFYGLTIFFLISCSLCQPMWAAVMQSTQLRFYS